jgi:hypothetical protein
LNPLNDIYDCSINGDLHDKIVKNSKAFSLEIENSKSNLENCEVTYISCIIESIFQLDDSNNAEKALLKSLYSKTNSEYKQILMCLIDPSVSKKLESSYQLNKQEKTLLKNLSLISKFKLSLFMKTALEICSINNNYAILNVLFFANKNEAIIFQFMPYGLLIDKKLNELVFTIYSDLKNFRFRQFKSIDEMNLNLNTKIQSLVSIADYDYRLDLDKVFTKECKKFKI